MLDDPMRLLLGGMITIATTIVVWVLQRKLLPKLDAMIRHLEGVADGLVTLASVNDSQHGAILRRQDETNGRLLKQERVSSEQGEKIARLDERTATMLQVERWHTGINGGDKPSDGGG